jgi:hypothetical protein
MTEKSNKSENLHATVRDTRRTTPKKYTCAGYTFNPRQHMGWVGYNTLYGHQEIHGHLERQQLC